MKKTLLALLFSQALFATENVPTLKEWSGFQSPESVYATQDSVFVSNLGSKIEPLAKDGDGFIVKLNQEGKIISKISGLDAPKGMSLSNNILYVNDIDTIKGFDLKTQKEVFNLPIKGSIFLNDLVMLDSQTLLSSDTGSGKIYTIDLKSSTYKVLTQIDSKKYGGGPNGLAYENQTLFIATYDPNQKAKGKVLKFSMQSKTLQVFSNVQGFLDGLAFDSKGNLFVSSWGENLAGKVYQISPKGQSMEFPIRPIQGCADIFYLNGDLYIPAMVENKVLKLSL